MLPTTCTPYCSLSWWEFFSVSYLRFVCSGTFLAGSVSVMNRSWVFRTSYPARVIMIDPETSENKQQMKQSPMTISPARELEGTRCLLPLEDLASLDVTSKPTDILLDSFQRWHCTKTTRLFQKPDWLPLAYVNVRTRWRLEAQCPSTHAQRTTKALGTKCSELLRLVLLTLKRSLAPPYGLHFGHPTFPVDSRLRALLVFPDFSEVEIRMDDPQILLWRVRWILSPVR